MATATIAPPKVVVSFPSREIISQVELALFMSLRGRLQQLEEQVTAAQEEIKARLQAGAIVQPGDNIARLDERSRRNVAWRKVAEDLGDIVFGDGKGQEYCEQILASTPPTATVNLVVR